MDTAGVLRQLFEDSGLSYVELEKRTGIPKSVLQRYAAGETRKIPVDAIERIARAMNLSPAQLLGWQENADEQEEIIRLDADSLELLRTVRERPEMKILFSVSKNVTPEDLQKAIRIIEALKENEG